MLLDAAGARKSEEDGHSQRKGEMIILDGRNNIVGKVQRKKSLLTYLGHRDHPRFPIVKIIKGSIIVTSNIFSTPTFPHYTL